MRATLTAVTAMTMLYHFRVLERAGPRVRLRLWVTNPDVLGWGAKAVPKNPRNLLNTPYFAAGLVREQCRDGDALTVAYAAKVAVTDRAIQARIAAGKPEIEPLGDPTGSLWRTVIGPTIASLKVEGVSNFPAPKHAWDIPKTPAAATKRVGYWSAWQAWDGHADPPDGLARFDLILEFCDPKWMPSGWPSGIGGTTAYAMQ